MEPASTVNTGGLRNGSTRETLERIWHPGRKRGLTVSDVLYFDAFTEIGPRLEKHPAEAWRLSDLLAEMSHCSISGALVASTQSVAYDAMYGNLALSAAIDPHRHLFAVWNVLPHHTGEFPAPSALGPKMREHAVRAVTIRPKTNAWDWEADHAQDLLAWLAEERILTILARHEFGHYRELDRFLGRHSRLPLLLTGAGYDEQRFVLPLLKKHSSLHISFDVFQVHYGLEYLVGEGLEDQLVFASHAPRMAMGAHRTYVDYAEVAPAVQRKIAGGNLIRLLDGQQPPSILTNQDEDILMAAVRQGKPLPVPVIDLHMHIVHEGLSSGGLAYRTHRGGPEGVFHLLERLGYRGGGFMSLNGPMGDARTGNECVREVMDGVPPGYWGLATFDPAHFSQSELETLIPQTYSDHRFIGMKPYHFYPQDYADPSYDVWWAYGNRHHLYAIIDRNYRDDFREIESLATRYPRVRWVAAHTGRDFKRAAQAAECIAKHDNVFAEINLASVPLGMIDYLVQHAGEDRVVYGSDVPVLDPRQPLGWVVFSRLPLEAKMKVLGENALTIIRPCAARLPEHHRPPGL